MRQTPYIQEISAGFNRLRSIQTYRKYDQRLISFPDFALDQRSCNWSPVKKATEVALPNAPSLTPSLSVGVICAVAAGMTDMKMPEANPYTQVNPTSTAVVFAGSHMAKQNTPQRVTMW